MDACKQQVLMASLALLSAIACQLASLSATCIAPSIYIHPEMQWISIDGFIRLNACVLDLMCSEAALCLTITVDCHHWSID